MLDFPRWKVWWTWLLILLGVAFVVSTFVDNDWNGMPGLVVPGIVLVATGLVLVAWAVLRAGVLPRWTALLLVASAVLLPFANEQTSRILLAVPFGLCWMVAGAVLLRGATHQPEQVSPVNRHDTRRR